MSSLVKIFLSSTFETLRQICNFLLLDQVSDPGAKEEDFPKLKQLEGRWMANLGCLYSMDREHGTNIRDDAKPKQHWNN